jgi:hypothetical protein
LHKFKETHLRADCITAVYRPCKLRTSVFNDHLCRGAGFINYFLGHDIYRFLWLRSFHKPMVFSLHKDGKKVWLTTKQLNKQPQFIDITWSKFVEPFVTADGEIDTANFDEKYNNRVDSVIKADRKANIILNQTIPLSNEEWEEFKSLLNAASFWTSAPLDTGSGLDGSNG